METVGVYLKKAREAINISLQDVARLTKISSVYLEHIEKNEFEKIPQGPYVKGYIASYSRAIGCDVAKVIALYESVNRRRIQTEAAQPDAEMTRRGAHEPEKSSLKTRQPGNGPNAGRSGMRKQPAISVIKENADTRKSPGKAVEPEDGSQPRHASTTWQDTLPATLSGGTGAIHRWVSDRRVWLVVGLTIVGACIFLLAGIGFYHLFVYDSVSVTVDAIQPSGGEDLGPPHPSGSPSVSTPLQPAGASTAVEAKKNGDAAVKQARLDASATGGAGPAENGEISAPPAPASSAPEAVPASSPAAPSDAPDPPIARSQRTVASAAEVRRSDPPPTPTDSALPMTVLKATVCRAVDNRMPVGVDLSFPASIGKVYVWTEIESSQVPTTVHHIYYLGGEKISDVSLRVRSTRWRTWSFKTIAASRDQGAWRVDIATSEGDILRQLYFEIN